MAETAPPPCANPHVIVPQAPSLIWNHRRIRAHGQYRTQEVVKACKEAQGEVLTHSLHVGGTRPPLDPYQRNTHWVDRLFLYPMSLRTYCVPEALVLHQILSGVVDAEETANFEPTGRTTA